jgi:phosphatidylglycerol:prolipoprotein diacylglycerol transferase
LLFQNISLHPLLYHFGHLAIPTYGALIALALVAGLAALIQFARRLGLDPNKLWMLGLIGILTTLIAARLLLAIEYFGAFRQHPFWVLGLTSLQSRWIIYAAAAIGLAAAILYALAEGLPLLRVLDCIAPCAALGFAISGIGAFLAGVDFGLPAVGSGWAVTYTSPFSAFWYHTPFGVRLYPVQIYEVIASLAIFAALLWRLPRRAQDGELAGAWLFLYAIAGFFLDFYRAAAQNNLFLRQLVFAFMVIASAPLLLGRNSGGYTEVDDPSRT